jgi:septal ring factor EnvC (AmiA/AmiB activator)
LGFKEDTLLKQWMNREKVAVDYGRLCDKRIAELEAQISERQAHIHTSTASRTGLEQQIAVTESIVKELSAEIKQLRAQLSHAKAPTKERSENALTKMRVLRLEAVVETAKAGLDEELRIAKKSESTLEDSILVSEGEDLIPPRWLALKRALQPLHSATASLKAKQA